MGMKAMEQAGEQLDIKQELINVFDGRNTKSETLRELSVLSGITVEDILEIVNSDDDFAYEHKRIYYDVAASKRLAISPSRRTLLDAMVVIKDLLCINKNAEYDDIQVILKRNHHMDIPLSFIMNYVQGNINENDYIGKKADMIKPSNPVRAVKLAVIELGENATSANIISKHSKMRKKATLDILNNPINFHKIDGVYKIKIT